MEPISLKRQRVVVLTIAVDQRTDIGVVNLVRFQRGHPMLDRNGIQPFGQTGQLILFH